VALLILGGQRRSEVAALQWDWIYSDTVHVPAAYVKNGRDHVYPIGPESQAILASLPRLSDTYVFPAMRQSKPTTTVFNGWGKPMARFRAKLGVEVKPFVLHDLRRVFASGLQRLGVRLEVTESLLGHVSGTRAGIVGVYQVYRYEAEKREAIRQWEAYLAKFSSLT
jgi:integrase